MGTKLISLGAASLVGFAILLASLSVSNARGGDNRAERAAWVAKCLKQIQTVQPGMKRKEMQKVLTTEGGLYSPSTGHYVSRECPYFKVDVEFKTGRERDGRAVAGPDDRIVRISQPYMQWQIID
jgi:hypothetical protein